MFFIFSDKKTEDETEWEAKERLTNRRCIWLRGMPGMTAYEAALTIIEEAQQTIEQGLGSVGLKWEEQEIISMTDKSATVSTNKKNISIHRPQSNFTKFLKINSQKYYSHEAGNAIADNSDRMKASPVQQNTQSKSIILSPPPGFADKSTSKVCEISGSKVCQTGLTTADQSDNVSVSKKPLANMQSEVNGRKGFSLNLDSTKENSTCKNVNPESVSEMIQCENKTMFLESPKKDASVNMKLSENQSIVGKKLLCKSETPFKFETEPPTNAPPRVFPNKKNKDQKTKNSTSISTVSSVVGQAPTRSLHHVKSSPAQMSKSDASTTPTTHCEVQQQLFTTSTPIDEEQPTLDKPPYVNDSRQATTKDTCSTPVNNGNYKSIQTTDICSSTVRSIQPKQLISASFTGDDVTKKQTKCIEDGRKIIKDTCICEVNNGDQNVTENDPVIIAIAQDKPASNMTADPKLETSESDSTLLTPECNGDSAKGKDNVAEIPPTLDVFADSFVIDTQMAEMMDVNMLVAEKHACTKHIPEKIVPEQKGDLPVSETSPVLFVEEPGDVDIAATKAETKCNNFLQNDLPMVAQGSNHPDDLFSNEQLFMSSEESHFRTMSESQELLPASNYERLVYNEENMQNSFAEENDLFNSYDDLRIPYESGQEAIFVLNANTKQEQSEKKKICALENKPDSNLDFSNDDLFTPLPVDIEISILERQEKDNYNFDDFFKPMSFEVRNQAEAHTSSDSSQIELKCESTEYRIPSKEHTNLVKIGEKHLQQTDSSVIIQSGSRKRKQNFSCHNENVLETKAKKAALVSKEKESSSSVEQNLSTGSDCYPPTPPDDLFSETLQLSPIATPQLFGKNNSSLRKSSQRRKSPRFRNLDVDSGTANLQSISNNKNEAVSQKYCTRTRKQQLNKKATENIVKERVKNPSDLAILSKGASSAAMSSCNQVTGQDTVSKNLCNFEGMDSDEGDMCGNLDESKPIQPLCDASQHCSQNEFTIIDVCSNRQLFDTFILEWDTQKKYALSIGCEKLLSVDPTLGIGGNFMEGKIASQTLYILSSYSLIFSQCVFFSFLLKRMYGIICSVS